MAENQDVLQTPDVTSEFDPQDINQNKVMALLAYFGILFLVPLLAAKDSKFAKFHANQGIVLFICEIAACIVTFFLSFLFGLINIGWLGSLLGYLLYLACGILAIMGIINAAQGKAKELPLIGKIKILK